MNNCMECEAEFSFFKRKHHCRACGAVVCSGCSPYQAIIPTLDEAGGSRVCVNCFGLKVNLGAMKQSESDILRDDNGDDQESNKSGEGARY